MWSSLGMVERLGRFVVVCTTLGFLGAASATDEVGMPPEHVFVEDPNRPKAALHAGTGISFPYRVRPFSREDIWDTSDARVAAPFQIDTYLQRYAGLLGEVGSSSGGYIEYGAPLDRVNIFIALEPQVAGSRARLFREVWSHSRVHLEVDFSKAGIEPEPFDDGRSPEVSLETCGIVVTGRRDSTEVQSRRRLQDDLHVIDHYIFEYEGHELQISASYPKPKAERSQAMVMKFLQDLPGGDPDELRGIQAKRDRIARSEHFSVVGKYIDAMFRCDGEAVVETVSSEMLERHQEKTIGRLAAIRSADSGVILKQLFGQEITVGELRKRPAGFVVMAMSERMTKPFFEQMGLEVERVVPLSDEIGGEGLRRLWVRIWMKSSRGPYVAEIEVPMKRVAGKWFVHDENDFLSFEDQFKATGDRIGGVSRLIRTACVMGILLKEEKLAVADREALGTMLEVGLREGGESADGLLAFLVVPFPGLELPLAADCVLEESLPVFSALADIEISPEGQLAAALERRLASYLEGPAFNGLRMLASDAKREGKESVGERWYAAEEIIEGRLMLEFAERLDRDETVDHLQALLEMVTD